MRYICSWSGGKDSTASIILAHLYGEPLDTIIFSEVMYDIENNISGENPLHIDFVRNVAKPLFEAWGYEVLILRSDRDYKSVFHHVIKHPRKRMEHAGMEYGFVASKQCAVKRDCKLPPIEDYLKRMKACGESFVQYIGICADEPDRLRSMHKSPELISLLEKYGYTESMNMKLCKEHGLLSPTYKFSKRGGCFFCPNAKVREHVYVKENMPEVWEEFVSLEEQPNLAFDRWNVFGETLKERDKKVDRYIADRGKPRTVVRQLHLFDAPN